MKIGTHSGRFHADEVHACMLLKYLYNIEGEEIEIIRTRDYDILNQCDIVVDVGGVYDPRNRRFDHHQKECNETLNDECNVPLSSFGMVYKYYGEEFIEYILDEIDEDILDKNHDIVDIIYNKIYHEYVKEIDANDNGYSNLKDEFVDKNVFKFNKKITMPGIVFRYNGDNVYNSDEQLRRFMDAGEVCWNTFMLYVEHCAKEIIELENDRLPMTECFNNRDNPRILIMDKNMKTYRTHLNELDVNKEICFIVYPKGNEYGVSSIQEKHFINKVDLADPEMMKKEIGDDFVFIHKNLFCGSAKTKESAIKICERSLEIYDKLNSKYLIVSIMSYIRSLLKF